MKIELGKSLYAPISEPLWRLIWGHLCNPTPSKLSSKLDTTLCFQLNSKLDNTLCFQLNFRINDQIRVYLLESTKKLDR